MTIVLHTCLNLAIGPFRSIHTYTCTHMHAIQLEYGRICVLSECCICCERNEILLGGFTVLLWLNTKMHAKTCFLVHYIALMLPLGSSQLALLATSDEFHFLHSSFAWLVLFPLLILSYAHQGSSESGHRNFFVTPGLQQHVFPTIGRCGLLDGYTVTLRHFVKKIVNYWDLCQRMWKWP